jgi:hypothetical protein
MVNTETQTTLDIQDTWQVNVRENRRDNQEWSIQRHRQHWTYKTHIFYVSCMSYVVCVSVLTILDCPFVFLLRLFVMCLVCPMLSVSLYWSFLIAPSVFSNLYLSCVLYVQCFLCLCIDHSWLPLRFSLTFTCHVSCMSNVVCLCIDHSWLPLWFSLSFICHVSCMSNVVCVSEQHRTYKTHDK